MLTEDKSRLSINGWFHGPPIKRPPPYIEKPLPLKPHGQIEQEMVYEWINEIYLDPEVQSQIQEKFENDSEIELQGFLKVCRSILHSYQRIHLSFSFSHSFCNMEGRNIKSFNCTKHFALAIITNVCNVSFCYIMYYFGTRCVVLYCLSPG